MSASPAATRQNFSDEPALVWPLMARVLSNSSVLGSGCERLDTATNPSLARGRRLLRHHRHVREMARQLGQDQGLGFLVGVGHRRAVGLDARIAAGLVMA